MVTAIVHTHIQPHRHPKQRFIAGSAVAVAVAGGFLLGIRLCFQSHALKQIAIRLALHQRAADQLEGNLLGGAGEKESGDGLGELCGYGSGFVGGVE